DRWSIENSVGFHFTHHKLNNETSVDLCSEAFAKINVDPKSVDLLIVVSQHTRPNIPPLSAKLAGALKMDPRVYNLDLSIGCTGY
ncbi:hypothetical protein ACE4Z6_27625, partial [Salmonella enterica]|uniref:hypothetical protein n=1 Tax=Salmonella enterica TaxID=28901 RepID=UPI003D2DE2A3